MIMKLMLLGMTTLLSGVMLFCADYMVILIAGSIPDVTVGQGLYTQYAQILIIIGFVLMMVGLFKE